MMSQFLSAFIETKAKKMGLQPDLETPHMRPETGLIQGATGLNSTPSKTDIPKANPAFDLKKTDRLTLQKQPSTPVGADINTRTTTTRG